MSQQLTLQIPDSEKLLGLFIEDCHDRDLTDETIRRYKSIVERFLGYLQQRSTSPQHVDKHVVHDYIRLRRENHADGKTLENELSAVASLYEFLIFEDYVGKNPVIGVRKRYMRKYKSQTEGDTESPRKLISVEEMSMLVNSVIDVRDKAILVLLAKTGLRRNELISVDITNIDWAGQSIMLERKRFKKRSGRTVFFDDETARVLKRWLAQRENLHPDTPALFVGERGRLKRHGVYQMVVKYATAVGLHNPKSTNPEDHFTPHCCRHWFTTHLRKAGMDREFIKVLRGDRRKEAIDIYDRIDKEELRMAYLAFVPQLGI